nr:outer membrane beta-barrel protein [Fermentimonas sp.]
FPGYGTFALKETVNQQYAFLSEYSREGAYTDIKHEQPITLGLTLRYNINDKWNITSGITYSLLSSKLRSQGENYYYDDNQKLHYIGVPLNIAYNFWQNNNFLGYFTAGAHMQKNVCGRLVSNYYIDNQLESTTSERITEKELQWSVNSAVGIEYRVSDYLGLYAEPGIDYYFKNSSELKTIYKDRPFSFNLRVGIRFTFND